MAQELDFDLVLEFRRQTHGVSAGLVELKHDEDRERIEAVEQGLVNALPGAAGMDFERARHQRHSRAGRPRRRHDA